MWEFVKLSQELLKRCLHWMRMEILKSSCKSVMQTSLFLKSLQAINKSRFNTLNVQTSLMILFSFTNVSKTGIWTQVSKDDEALPFTVYG